MIRVPDIRSHDKSDAFNVGIVNRALPVNSIFELVKIGPVNVAPVKFASNGLSGTVCKDNTPLESLVNTCPEIPVEYLSFAEDVKFMFESEKIGPVKVAPDKLAFAKIVLNTSPLTVTNDPDNSATLFCIAFTLFSTV